jgi:two-component system response regulator FixJ
LGRLPRMDNDKTTIMVVDDDPAVCDSLKFALELEGLTVHTCTSGPELLRHPDLGQARCLVLDYKMPEMDGFEILDRLDANVPVILIAGPVTSSIRERARHAGVLHVLEKPLLDSALIDRIREITQGAGR